MHPGFVGVDPTTAESEVQHATVFRVLFGDTMLLQEVPDGVELALLTGLEEW
jgi:hypothetical protein